VQVTFGLLHLGKFGSFRHSVPVVQCSSLYSGDRYRPRGNEEIKDESDKILNVINMIHERLNSFR
jgi:hypothetical protein